MNPADDPMRSQHLTLGAEAFPGWHPFSGDFSQAIPAAHGKTKASRLVTRLTGNSLLGLALMFSGNAQAEVEPAQYTLKGSEFTMAMRQYEDCHWQVAFERFADLAQQGHGEAARMAWQMWRYGPELFGIEFSVEPDQRQRWLAAWRGSPAKADDARAAGVSP
jgi:hypothetical protein